MKSRLENGYKNRLIERESFDKVLQNPKNLRDRAIMELLYCTGMRSGELVKIKVEDVDLRRRTIKIIDSKKKVPFMLPITQRCTDVLAEYTRQKTGYTGRYSKPNSEWLFPSLFKKGRPITTRAVGDAIKRGAIFANIKEWEEFNARYFRYRMARNWMNKKGTLTKLQELLRHGRVSTTAIYVEAIRFSDEVIREEYDSIME